MPSQNIREILKMAVYLMKIEGEGEKPIEGTTRSVQVFTSRNALFTANDSQDPAIGACDQRLRSEVEEALRHKGSTHWTWSGGSRMEISKERLLELAEHARTRDQMAAEREPLQTV